MFNEMERLGVKEIDILLLSFWVDDPTTLLILSIVYVP